MLVQGALSYRRKRSGRYFETRGDIVNAAEWSWSENKWEHSIIGRRGTGSHGETAVVAAARVTLWANILRRVYCTFIHSFYSVAGSEPMHTRK